MAGAPSRVESDQYVNGNLSCKTFSPPAGCISDAAIPANAGIQATKVIHQFSREYQQPAGADVASAAAAIHFVYGAIGTVVAVKVFPLVAPTGGDKAFTVDIQKSSGGGAFATILSSVVTVNNTSTSLAVQTATVSVPGLVAGDVLKVVITDSGSTGSQGQGVLVTIVVQEAAQ